MKYLRNELLKKHTSFHIGGPADYLCVPKNAQELKEALLFAKNHHLDTAVIGGGTNVLALDKGFRGLVIKLLGGLNKISVRGRVVYAEAGVPISRFLNTLLKYKLTGAEFLAGIPGTVGGAVVMNAGAWGKEIGRSLLRVKVVNNQGEEFVLAKNKLGLGYRKSVLQKGKYILTEAVFRFRKGQTRLIKKKMAEALKKRKETQPLGIPNAGCIFKNPPGGYAGKILEEAGCKGMRVGDAQVSTKHANFIVNLGDATARDILRLITKIQKKVPVKLEPEIKIVIKSL